MNNVSIIVEGLKSLLQWSDQYASRKLLIAVGFVALLAYGVYGEYVDPTVAAITGAVVVCVYIIARVIGDLYEN